MKLKSKMRRGRPPNFRNPPKTDKEKEADKQKEKVRLIAEFLKTHTVTKLPAGHAMFF